MTHVHQETDYLIIGAGAMGIAFADGIFNKDKSAHITIVDRQDSFGGHWKNAYPYVGLHQPAAFYGVNSRVLGRGTTDLSSKGEILDYYQKIHDMFVASGRVNFLGEHEYIGENKVTPVGDEENVISFNVKRRLVNATYMGVEVPSTHPPKFEVAEEAPFVPLNDLAEIHKDWEQFYILGNGKTGMDAVLYLLKQGVDPDNIHWVMPNDSWCFLREYLQVRSATKSVLQHCAIAARTQNSDTLFFDLAEKGNIVRLDEKIEPTKWRCATVSEAEVIELRRIKNTVRKGRVKRVTKSEIKFTSESITYPARSLIVNCTADGLAKRAAAPLFSKGRIDLQAIFFCQQVFSAAAIARMELSTMSDEKRNRVVPVPHPEFPQDYTAILSKTIDNFLIFGTNFPFWTRKSRLNFMSYEPLWYYLWCNVQALFLAPKLRKAHRKIVSETTTYNIKKS